MAPPPNPRPPVHLRQLAAAPAAAPPPTPHPPPRSRSAGDDAFRRRCADRPCCPRRSRAPPGPARRPRAAAPGSPGRMHGRRSHRRPAPGPGWPRPAGHRDACAARSAGPAPGPAAPPRCAAPPAARARGHRPRAPRPGNGATPAPRRAARPGRRRAGRRRRRSSRARRCGCRGRAGSRCVGSHRPSAQGRCCGRPGQGPPA